MWQLWIFFARNIRIVQKYFWQFLKFDTQKTRGYCLHYFSIILKQWQYFFTTFIQISHLSIHQFVYFSKYIPPIYTKIIRVINSHNFACLMSFPEILYKYVRLHILQFLLLYTFSFLFINNSLYHFIHYISAFSHFAIFTILEFFYIFLRITIL